jgi:hypothetical protein
MSTITAGKYTLTLKEKKNVMLEWLPVITTMAITLLTAILTPSFLAIHPVVFAVLNALAMLLHAILPSVLPPEVTTSK